MKFRNLVSTAALALLPLTLNAATLVIPFAGSGTRGDQTVRRETTVTLHNASPRPISLELSYHQGDHYGPVTVNLKPRQTVSIADAVRTQFGIANGTGAITVDLDPRAARGLAVTSRTSFISDDGQFGLDIAAVDPANAARAGEVVALAAADDDAARFEFGFYALDDATVSWELVRADGSVAATKPATYAFGDFKLYESGIGEFFGQPAAANDTVRARLVSGKGVAFGNVFSEEGDPEYVAGVRTRDDSIILFTGVDLDENGTIDIADADHDGVLDAPIDVYTSMFPAYMRVVGVGEFGETIEYEVVSSPASRTDFLDAQGTLRIIASGDLKNTDGSMQIRLKSDAAETIVTVPLQFR